MGIAATGGGVVGGSAAVSLRRRRRRERMRNVAPSPGVALGVALPPWASAIARRSTVRVRRRRWPAYAPDRSARTVRRPAWLPPARSRAAVGDLDNSVRRPRRRHGHVRASGRRVPVRVVERVRENLAQGRVIAGNDDRGGRREIRRADRAQRCAPIRPPQPRALGLLLGHLEALLSPEPFHSLMVHTPAFLVQQRRDPPIPVPPILPCKGDDARPQGVLVMGLNGRILLRGATLPHHATRPAFRDREPLLRMADGFSASGRA